jgi:hypothetical protein
MRQIAARLLFAAALATNVQSAQTTNATLDEHIGEVMNGLSHRSELYNALSRGARGDGVRHPWMEDMKKLGIKRVEINIDINFDSHGRPKQMRIGGIAYFAQYESNDPISDPEQLRAIRELLEKRLDDIGLKRAARGVWLDVPRPRPRPFVGATRVELLDDEWLPTPSPMFHPEGER